jgi:hypothetical protein
VSYAFTLATHDPATAERAMIAGREFFARRFTLSEVNQVAADIRAAVETAVSEKRAVAIEEEMRAIVKVLNTRLADGGKKVTADDLSKSLTEEEYKALLWHYAPALMPKEAPAEGNA